MGPVAMLRSPPGTSSKGTDEGAGAQYTVLLDILGAGAQYV